MFTQQKTIKPAFTLVELLVVIVIIGILATLTTVTLTNVRTNARDARRISDLKQISSALELYYADNNTYPTVITPGNALTDQNNTKTYMAKIPTNPTPRAEGACANLDYQYAGSTNDYSLIGCLAKASSNTPAGARKIEKGGATRDLGPTDGLVGWWMLDGFYGGKDLSGNNNNGAPSGNTSTSTGRYGETNGAYRFADGNTDLFTLSSNVAFPQNSNLSLSLYLKWSGSIGSFVIPIGDNVSQSYIYLKGTSYYIDWRANDNNESVLSTPSNWTQVLFDGNWHHLVLSVSSNETVKAYIDGGVKRNTNENISLDSSMIFKKFGDAYGSTYGWQGYMADIRIYNKALSQTEIQAIYDATKP